MLLILGFIFSQLVLLNLEMVLCEMVVEQLDCNQDDEG
jgi:hypothetical protein